MNIDRLPGARWWKVDFHAHSPSSFDFGAEEGRRATDATPTRDWLLVYMAAAVDAIVVTDHNSHDGIDIARTALEELRAERPEGFRDLTLIAGVEITVDGGYHLLAVFDVDTPAEVINGLLHNCNYQGDRGASDGTTAFSFQEVMDAIALAGGLAIPAHADGPAGFFSHDQRNRELIIAAGKIFAAEVTSADGEAKALAAGWTPVLGSDAHHLDDSGRPNDPEAKFPGSHFSWVKMERPDLNGLKLAIADGPTSVRRSTSLTENPNDFTHSVIEGITVSKGGAQVEHRFSPWMNAIIGGRGVGKSTLMELIRLTLGRFGDLPSRLQDDQGWFSPVKDRPDDPRFWSDDTEVVVLYTKLGRQYKITWRGDDPSTSSIDVLENGDWRSEGGYASERFPVLLNSQKQIYETAQDPQSLLKIIDEQPAIDYPSWLDKFRDLSGQYRTQRSEIAELEAKIATEGRISGELSDVQGELDHLALLRDSPDALELDLLRSLEAQLADREAAAMALETALKASVLAFRNEMNDGPLADDMWPLESQRNAAVLDAATAVETAVESLESSRLAWDDASTSTPRQDRILELRKSLRPETDATEGEVVDDAAAEDLDDKADRLSGRKTELTKSIRDIEAAKLGVTELAMSASETLVAIRSHRAELTVRRTNFVGTLGDREFKLDIFAQADEARLEADLRRLFSRPGSFDSLFAADGFRSVLGVNAFDPRYAAAIDRLKSLLKELRTAGRQSPILGGLAALTVDQRFFQHLDSLDADQFQTDVDLWFPEDKLRVRYKQENDGNFRNLDEGSPGQKTAALLAVILQLSDDPLLLDQPEDDLDNKLIYDLVVKTLKRIKSTRQVIVVTHNANVVVNADAEFVAVMQHADLPTASQEGSIQDENIKQAICLIMEGGEEAFAARYRRLLG
jgi:hypothetical protein